MSKNENLKKNELSLDDLEQASGGVIEKKKEIAYDDWKGDYVKVTNVVKDDTGKVWGEYDDSYTGKKQAETANDMLKKMGKTTK